MKSKIKIAYKSKRKCNAKKEVMGLVRQRFTNIH